LRQAGSPKTLKSSTSKHPAAPREEAGQVRGVEPNCLSTIEAIAFVRMRCTVSFDKDAESR
jgi:hypothetical protein